MSELPASVRLADADVYNVVSAAGNNELKALTLGVMEPDVPYTGKPLTDRVRGLMPAEDRAWTPNDSTVLSYCKTFSDAASLAVKANVGAEAYMLTERGVRLGRPLAGHMLGLSLAGDAPLFGFFGGTQTNSGQRPSRLRIRMMRFLSEKDGRQSALADVAAAAGVAALKVGEAADRMSSFGILEYESSGRAKPSIRYGATPELAAPPPLVSYSLLGRHVNGVLRTHFRDHPDDLLSNEDIARMLVDTYGYKMPLDDLIAKVGGRTKYLSDVHKVLRPVRQFEGPTRAVLRANAAQLAVMSTALDAVGGLWNPTETYLDDGMEKLEAVLADENTVNSLVAKAKAASAGRKARTEESQRCRDATVAVFADTQALLSVRDVHTQLLAAGVNVSAGTVRSYVQGLVASGTLEKVETAQGDRYRRR